MDSIIYNDHMQQSKYLWSLQLECVYIGQVLMGDWYVYVIDLVTTWLVMQGCLLHVMQGCLFHVNTGRPELNIHLFLPIIH